MPIWARAVAALAIAKVAFGVTVYLSGFAALSRLPLVPGWVYAVLSTTFAALGGLLVVGNRRDPRAAWLGGLLALMAAPLAPVVNTLSEPSPFIVAYLRPEALLPAFLWRFLTEFPDALSGTGGKAVRGLSTVAALVGVICAGATLSTWWAAAPPWLRPFALPGGYWLVIFGMTLPVFPILVWRARTAPAEEQPRMQIFVRGLLAGVAP